MFCNEDNNSITIRLNKNWDKAVEEGFALSDRIAETSFKIKDILYTKRDVLQEDSEFILCYISDFISNIITMHQMIF